MLGYNARSVFKNKASLEAVLHSYQYDIVFVNETWLTPSKVFQLEDRQYQIVRNDDSEGYRGTAILYKSELQVCLVQLPESLKFLSISLVKVIMQ